MNRYRKFTAMSRTHYVWFCAAVEDYKYRSEGNHSKNFNLIILMTSNYELVKQSSLYIFGQLLKPIPTLGYRLKYMHKDTFNGIRIITPDPSSDRPEFFIGFSRKGQIFLHNLYTLSSKV